MRILPLHAELVLYLKRHDLLGKFEKQKNLFEENPFHISLHTEVLEPRQFKIYSFRVDRKYRAIFIYRSSNTVEIIDVNNHYKG